MNIKKIPIIDVNTERIIKAWSKRSCSWSKCRGKSKYLKFKSIDGTIISVWKYGRGYGWCTEIKKENLYCSYDDESEFDIFEIKFFKTKEKALNFAYDYMRKNSG